MKTEEAVQKLIGVARRQHKALETERSYANWLRRYCRFIIERKPSGGSVQRVEAFLTQLARQDVSASTQNQAFNALLFLYEKVLGMKLGDIRGVARAKKPKRLPVVLSKGEVARLLEAMTGTPQLIARLLYGTGMRLMAA